MTDDLTAQYVLAILPRGRDKARSLSDIAESTGLVRRTVERACRELRLEGWPLASCNDGMYLADPVDLGRTIASLEKRIVTQRQTITRLRKALDKMLPIVQTTLWSGEPNAA